MRGALPRYWPGPIPMDRPADLNSPPSPCHLLLPPHRSPGPGGQEAAGHGQRRGPQAQWRVSWEGSSTYWTQLETGGG